MLPLYRTPHFTFRFAEDRIVPRFHLEGVAPGTRVLVYALDPLSGDKLGLIASAFAGVDGWVDLTEPLVVRAGGGFIAEC